MAINGHNSNIVSLWFVSTSESSLSAPNGFNIPSDRRGGEKSTIAFPLLTHEWRSLMVTQLIYLGFGRSGLLNLSIQ
jgi:hypothetical protein